MYREKLPSTLKYLVASAILLGITIILYIINPYTLHPIYRRVVYPGQGLGYVFLLPGLVLLFWGIYQFREYRDALAVMKYRKEREDRNTDIRYSSD